MPYKRSAISYWLVGGLAVALVVLAGLQYRWIGQVSDAERGRMRNNLQIAVQQFRQDFSRDVLTLCAGFQADPEISEQGDWDRLARQGSEWLHTNSEAALVSSVYLWTVDGDRLSRLDRAEQRFEPIDPPAAMQPILKQFHSQATETGPTRMFRSLTWTFEASPTALIHPLTAFPEPGERGRPKLVGFLAIEINADYMRQKFLPDLATRHFAAGDNFLFNVAVVPGTDVTHAFYRSDGFNAAANTPADLNVAMLEPRPRTPGGPAGLGGPGNGSGFGRRRDGEDGPGGRDRDRGGPGGPGGPPPAERRDDRMRFRGNYSGGMRMAAMQQPAMLLADQHNQWRLVVRHRAGSVDTAVNEARWRDLAVSFATLLVLGASMAMIVVSTQRAQRLARLQMEFVAGISHELRTPLTVISTAAQNLSDGIVEGKPQVKVYGTLIRNESRRLSGMMEQILQFASGQKKRKYDPAPLAPAELIDSALTLAGSLLQDAGTTVELQVAPDLPNVMGESGALMQCLHNLIANGIKYGGDAKWLGVRAWADQEAVWIAVEDHGIGIEKAELPHIFDPFYRSSAVTSAQIHGTGLGLSLARNFAQEAGGSITVESTPGQGSTFLVRLPAMRAAVAQAARLSERTA